jgi:hypothetical protein
MTPDLDRNAIFTIVDQRRLANDRDFFAGQIAVVLALWSIMLTYFCFSVPLIFVFFAVATLVGSSWFLEGIGIVLFMPVAVTFLIWQAFRFFFPAYFDLVGLVGIFSQLAAFVRRSETLRLVALRRNDLFSDLRRLWGLFHA